MQNRAETIIHETGRAVNEYRSTLYAEVISQIESECIALHEAITKGDMNKMKEGIARVKRSAEKIGHNVYTEQSQNPNYSEQGAKVNPST